MSKQTDAIDGFYRRKCCDACAKPLKYHVHFDADGVELLLCSGCAGEATAFTQYGDEAVTSFDWREVRRMKLERIRGEK